MIRHFYIHGLNHNRGSRGGLAPALSTISMIGIGRTDIISYRRKTQQLGGAMFLVTSIITTQDGISLRCGLNVIIPGPIPGPT